MSKILLVFLIIFTSTVYAQQATKDEHAPYTQNRTYTFKEVVGVYEDLARQHHDVCRLQYIGGSDYGIPMPLFILNKDGIFNRETYHSKNVLLINNAIHPGEPCGVDASVKLVQELLSGELPANTIIAIIPIYNIGGAMNRTCCSRANQNGPEEYGFRGNARNLDLNRDFIKADSKNTHAFYQIFHLLKPAIFVDTHTSNGADYKHTLTLITSQLNKMTPSLAEYTENILNPALHKAIMAKHEQPMVPYVHTISATPDDGIKDYLETPRYSTGYTNLFNAIGYVTEAHMLKPYQDRVEYTFTFLHELIKEMEKNAGDLRNKINEANKAVSTASELPLSWKLDTTQYAQLNFWGYAAEYKKSAVTGKDRLYYNHDKPYKKDIRYYNTYTPSNFVSVPDYYIIPKAWDNIVALLLENDITIYKFAANKTLEVEGYYIDDFKTTKSPYEGHYMHYGTSVTAANKSLDYKRGDYIVPVKNKNARFIVETLEPHAPDSYFSWNYFDAILQQKEWFSSYVFEDEAVEILANNAVLKEEFETKKRTDSTFAANPFEQLYFIYKNSDHYERTANFYPVTRYHSTFETSDLVEMN